VDTGNTLRANGLVPMEHIMDVSSRLVVNKGSMKMKQSRIKRLIEQIGAAVEAS
jgi:ATP phosphoribosyltransferase